MKTHFAQRLITELINNEIIREGITIPFLVRAYKINNGDDSLISEEYIKYVFNHIVEDNDKILYIKQCTQVGNHRTISIATSDEIEEFNSDIRYKSLKNNDGNSIIYFEINFECSEVSIENICKLFWNYRWSRAHNL